MRRCRACWVCERPFRACLQLSLSALWFFSLFEHNICAFCSIENYEGEKEHGIVFVDNYSDEDWIKYRDVAFMRVGSYEWCEWTSAHWSEELFRRHINYTYPCYQEEENIDWIYNCNWCFDREQYYRLVASCKPQWCMDGRIETTIWRLKQL